MSDFKRNLAEAAKATQDATKSVSDAVSKNEQHINTLSNTAGGLGLAMVAAAGLAVKAFADFDESMSAVEAATHESAEGMGALRDAALEAGARTKYSATEAAGAVENLAKAGVSTADILGGGLDGALDLAAAGSMGVADAAEIAASTLTQFGLKGDKASHVADLLAAGAGKAQGEVSDMGAALNQAGLVANQMGLSVEETTGTLAAFAKAGLIGSDAGTSFRAMLLRLANPTKESAQLMSDLGINAYDAGGQFVGMESLAGQLQDRLGDLTQEQRNAALAQIFGMDAVRSASILYEQGADGVADWTEAVNETGYAAETAAIRMNNLKGDVEQFGGALETALIKAGESGDGPLRALVQGATDVVNALSEMPPAAQTALLGIVGGGGLVLLGVAGLGKLVVAFNDAVQAAKALGISAKVAGIAAGAVGGALAIAAIGLTVWAENSAKARARTEELAATLDEFGNTTDATLESINKSLSADRGTMLDDLFRTNPGSAIDAARKIGIAVEDLQGYILGEADAIDRVNAAMIEYNATHSADTSAGLRKTLDDLSSGLTAAEKQTLQAAEANKVAGVESDGYTDAIAATTDALMDQTDTLQGLIDAQREASGVLLDVRDAQRQFEAATYDATQALEDNGKTLDITTEAGRANQQALDDITNAGWDLIESMEANGATQEDLQGVMLATRDRFIGAATAMGMGAEEANRLADELGLIPTTVATAVTVDTNQAFADLRRLRDEISAIQQAKVNANPSYSPASTTSTIVRAEGGIVYGPGTSTSDSIPARLSNGEYVIKASSVQRYGKSFFDGLNAQRFATGGYVGVGGGGGGGSFGAGDLASAFDGMALTLVVDGQPVRAIARAEVDAAQASRVSSIRRGAR